MHGWDEKRLDLSQHVSMTLYVRVPNSPLQQKHLDLGALQLAVLRQG